MAEVENQELQILQLLVQFLNRVELKGQEVPAFNAALEYLQKKAQPLLAAQQEDNPEVVDPIVTSVVKLSVLSTVCILLTISVY